MITEIMLRLFIYSYVYCYERQWNVLVPAITYILAAITSYNLISLLHGTETGDFFQPFHHINQYKLFCLFVFVFGAPGTQVAV